MSSIERYLTVGVDIGGTNTVYALVDPQGEIKEKGSFPTMQEGGFPVYVEKLAGELGKLISSADAPVKGIGIGAPCGNSRTGEIESPVHLGWGLVNIVDALKPHFPGLPVKVTNDANAAALGERAYGAAKDFTDFIEITLGTGVGSGIFVDGKLVTGPNGLAGELGHIRYKACEDRACGCGRNGCLDAWCSATGLVKTTKEMLAQSDADSPLRKKEDFTSYDVFLAASEGDEIAKQAFEKTGYMLGNAIADMVTFSAPQAVIIFGGLAQSGSLLLDHVKRGFKENVLWLYEDTEILLSTIPTCDAAILGAAALNN